MTDPKSLDSKRQKKRKEDWIYKVVEDTSKEKFYILDMFPYPSGAWLHVWHPKWYIASDSIARKKMLEWYNVLHPMWFDTFWLWTENYAIEHKMKPQDVAKTNIETYIKQLELFGTTYDRSRIVNTADPKYFKRTQSIFLKMYNHYYDENLNKAIPIQNLELKIQNWEIEIDNEDIENYLNKQRLAYVDYKPINRCPSCMTWLANEDLDDGKCERCWSAVEQKPMKQRVLRITKYAQRLLDWLNKLKRDESMKDLERNRIWKSEWTQFRMVIASNDTVISNWKWEISWDLSTSSRWQDWKLSFEVYTTRIDTVFGMSFVVMAPEHPLVDQITTKEFKKDVEKYKEEAKHKTQLERTELQKDKSWQFTWAYAINPFNWEQVPIYIADYVLANYGTWVVMAVPAHDERDFEFAKKYWIKIKKVVEPFVYYDSWDSAVKKWQAFIERENVCVILKDPQTEKYLCLDRKDHDMHGLITWWIEENEDIIETAKREIYEESGYKNIKFIKDPDFAIHTFFWHRVKEVNRHTRFRYLIFELINSDRDEITKKESSAHKFVWKTKEELKTFFTVAEWEFAINFLDNANYIFTDKWLLHDSWEFTWLTSDEAILSMQTRLEKNNLWWKKINYKMQDRVFSRQRYRWEPFPILRVDENPKLELSFYDQKTRQAILDWVKTLETRALNPEGKDKYFWNIQVWDIFKFNNKETWESVFVKVNKVYQRKNLEDLRNNQDKKTIEKMYKDKSVFKKIKTLEDFSKWRDFQEGYLDKINKNWLVWREFEIVQASQKIIPLDEKDLPLILPDVENYQPTGTVQWPLAAIDDRVNVTLSDGTKAKRETNTMPWRAGSSRYRLRYMDPNNESALVGKEQDAYRKNVDVYIWWAEHVTRHMIYARFWQKFLFDLWIVSQDEPFQEYHYVWLIMWEDWRKMSKRRWNVVNPDEIINEFWADTLRTYEMFMWPFDQAIARSTNGIKWVKKFLDKIVNLKNKIDDNLISSDKSSEILLHQTIKKLTEDIDGFRFNTAVSQLMILVNHLTEQEKISKDTFEKLVILVSPFAPHTAEELREQLWNEFSIFTKAKRPTYDEKYLVSDEVTLAVQVNWKMRWTILINKNADQNQAFELIKSDPKLSLYLTWDPKKIIYVQGKILNIII